MRYRYRGRNNKYGWKKTAVFHMETDTHKKLRRDIKNTHAIWVLLGTCKFWLNYNYTVDILAAPAMDIAMDRVNEGKCFGTHHITTNKYHGIYQSYRLLTCR